MHSFHFGLIRRTHCGHPWTLRLYNAQLRGFITFIEMGIHKTKYSVYLSLSLFLYHFDFFFLDGITFCWLCIYRLIPPEWQNSMYNPCKYEFWLFCYCRTDLIIIFFYFNAATGQTDYLPTRMKYKCEGCFDPCTFCTFTLRGFLHCSICYVL